MELKVESRNVELKKGWQIKIDEEKEKLLRHYAGFVLHLRVAIEAKKRAVRSGNKTAAIALVKTSKIPTPPSRLPSEIASRERNTISVTSE